MDPNLIPSFALEQDIAGRGNELTRMQRQVGLIQSCTRAAEKEPADFRSRYNVLEKLGDFFYYEMDRIFIVGTPIDPFFIFNVLEQSQNCGSDLGGRLDIFHAFRVRTAELLIGNTKAERMIRPDPFVLQDQMLGDGTMPVESQNNRFHQRMELS